MKFIYTILKNIQSISFQDKIQYYCLKDIDFLSLEPQYVFKYKIRRLNKNMVVYEKVGIYLYNNHSVSEYQKFKFVSSNYTNIEQYLEKIS